jgi:hypothetical protein
MVRIVPLYNVELSVRAVLGDLFVDLICQPFGRLLQIIILLSIEQAMYFGRLKVLTLIVGVPKYLLCSFIVILPNIAGNKGYISFAVRVAASVMFEVGGLLLEKSSWMSQSLPLMGHHCDLHGF